MPRLKNMQEMEEQMNIVTQDVIVKVGVVGVFTESNLQLFSEGKETF